MGFVFHTHPETILQVNAHRMAFIHLWDNVNFAGKTVRLVKLAHINVHRVLPNISSIINVFKFALMEFLEMII